MAESTVTLAEAKARLSELTERAAAGEEIIITKHGRAVARLAPTQRLRATIDITHLRSLTDRLPGPDRSSAASIRKLRDQARY